MTPPLMTSKSLCFKGALLDISCLVEKALFDSYPVFFDCTTTTQRGRRAFLIRGPALGFLFLSLYLRTHSAAESIATK
ncbi:hypothetical protein CDAR_18601 [Caerostris darwini]|uniref:Uncharacterized protein n=1 Tax=Caerostris darwini TaxID=1538125 RepID=A0AAV4V9V2_9ARAC|nr:hypothetical protein CDAR_18601 [Caerostris darwini]